MKAQKSKAKTGAFSLKTFEAAPKGFNPLTASKTTLLRHGIAPRPDEKKEPELYKAWHKVYSRELTHIIPEFTEIKKKQHRPGISKSKIKEGSSTSTNWSGVVVFPQVNDTFKWIIGNWMVPDPTQPAGQPTGSWYYSSAWVGIDGWGSNDVLQAGTSQDVLVQGTTTHKSVYAWWEWYPNYEMQISNFPVNAGDYMTCLICATSTTQATFYITNITTGTHTSFQVTAPSGTTLNGNCAEWIVEAPTVGGSLAKLVDYGATFFDNSYAYTKNNAMVNAGTGTTINMVDGSNNVLSQGIIEAAQVLKMQYK